jgi:hypothetical protein
LQDNRTTVVFSKIAFGRFERVVGYPENGRTVRGN